MPFFGPIPFLHHDLRMPACAANHNILSNTPAFGSTARCCAWWLALILAYGQCGRHRLSIRHKTQRFFNNIIRFAQFFLLTKQARDNLFRDPSELHTPKLAFSNRSVRHQLHTVYAEIPSGLYATPPPPFHRPTSVRQPCILHDNPISDYIKLMPGECKHIRLAQVNMAYIRFLFFVEQDALMMVASTMVPPFIICPVCTATRLITSKKQLSQPIILQQIPEFGQRGLVWYRLSHES